MVGTSFCRITLLLLLYCTVQVATAQEIVVSYANHPTDYDALLSAWGENKSLPKGYELPTLIALSHYPELKGIRIEFRFKQSGSTLMSKTTVWSLLQRPEKRTYLINIRQSNQVDSALLQYMTLDEQLGSLGHELAHTSDYLKKGFGEMVKVILGHLSRKYLDRQEYSTDDRAINHGLGFQLYRRRSIKQSKLQWHSTSTTTERYMKPSTVRSKMLASPLYKDFKKEIEELKIP